MLTKLDYGKFLDYLRIPMYWMTLFCSREETRNKTWSMCCFCLRCHMNVVWR